MKKKLIAFLLITMLVIGTIAPPIISMYREHQTEQAKNTINAVFTEKRKQQQQTNYDIQQSKRALKTLISVRTIQAGDIYVLTNAPVPITANLLPNHPYMGLGLRKIIADASERNPIEEFLDDEHKYGYVLMLKLLSNSISFAQSYINFAAVEHTQNSSNTPVINITIGTKYSDAEIDVLIAKQPVKTTKEELAKYYPSLKDGFSYKRYSITAKELQTGKVAPQNIPLQDMAFNAKNTYYFISTYQANLPITEQKALIEQFNNKFAIQTPNPCCKWQKVTLNNPQTGAKS